MDGGSQIHGWLASRPARFKKKRPAGQPTMYLAFPIHFEGILLVLVYYWIDLPYYGVFSLLWFVFFLLMGSYPPTPKGSVGVWYGLLPLINLEVVPGKCNMGAAFALQIRPALVPTGGETLDPGSQLAVKPRILSPNWR